jgi:hypothetical protein
MIDKLTMRAMSDYVAEQHLACSNEKGERIKRLLWLGVTTAEVAREVQIRESFVARVRQGRAMWAIQWPNGWIGPMPHGRDRKIRADGFVKMDDVREVLKEMEDGS